MAKCDEGYICEICQKDVGQITESDLYLRYVTGLLDPEVLHTSSERHIRCNPTLAQYIVADEFDGVVVDGPFDKRKLDPKFVAERETLITRGYHRLQELKGHEGSVLEYPLPDVIERLQSNSNLPSSEISE